MDDYLFRGAFHTGLIMGDLLIFLGDSLFFYYVIKKYVD
jgi:hypothetical protein